MGSDGRVQEETVAATDADLVQRTLDGDRRAFGVLVERHKNTVFGLVSRLMGPNDTEDVAQEAFLRAYRALGTFRGDAQFTTWLYRITWNVCLDRREQRSRYQSRELSAEAIIDDETDAPVEFADEDAALPDEILEAEDLRTQLAAHIDALPVHYKAVLTLYFYEQKSYDEMAEILGVPMNTVKVHLYRAKARLKIALEQEGAEDWGT
jgi:RNA polymerase sigma-70 factor (ECF subfamily)